jgi:hypothetical protein
LVLAQLNDYKKLSVFSKEELLAKSFEEFKSKNDTVINSKPLVLKELIDGNLQTEQVDDGHLILDEIAHSEEADSAEILVLKDYVEDHNKIVEVKNESAQITSVKSKNQKLVYQQDELIKEVNSLNTNVKDFKIIEGLEKFNTLDEARQFVKNHFQNDLLGLERFKSRGKISCWEFCPFWGTAQIDA